ncbi:MAG: nucleoside monophosphate kinase [Candidatus Micrarchaeota archaeon]
MAPRNLFRNRKPIPGVTWKPIERDVMRIVLVGAPGTGKGTVAGGITKRCRRFRHISLGELLRTEVAAKTELGLRVAPIMKKGDLVPNDDIFAVMRRRLPKRGSFILDGFPRTLEQAEAFHDLVKPDLVIALSLPIDVARERIENRLTCSNPNCGVSPFISSKKELKNAIGAKCPKCKTGTLGKRTDETNVNTVVTRMRTFEEKTQPVLEFYKNKGLLKSVNAAGTPQEVLGKVLKLLGGKAC